MTFLLSLLLSLFFPADAGDVAALGSDRFHEREAASRRLAARGWPALPSLWRGTQSPDPEVRMRATQAAEDVVAAELESLGDLPEIDAWRYDPFGRTYLPPPALASWYERHYLHLSAGEYPRRYGRWFEATRLACRDLLRAGVPAAVLRPVLAEMRRRDAVFLGNEAPDEGP